MTQRIPLMLIQPHSIIGISRRLSGIGRRLSSEDMESYIEKTDIGVHADIYAAASLVNCSFLAVFFSAAMAALVYFARSFTITLSAAIGVATGICISALFFLIFMRYPMILAKKKAEILEKNLIFALKDMLLQISSGVSLYSSIVNVANAGYGLISAELKKTAQAINSGKPMDSAMEALAIRSESEFLRKTVWQLVNTMRAGASIKGALESIIHGMLIDQRRKISDYAKELNLWSLIYMLFAVAIPAIGMTTMVILSSFAGMGLNNGIFITFILICFIVQYILIGLIKTRRPLVQI